MNSATLEAINKAGKMFAQSSGIQAVNKSGHVDVAAYLDHYGLDYKVKYSGNRTFYALKCCPFDSSHVNGDAAISQSTDGMLGFKCFHNSCQGKGWKEVREAISGSDSLKEFMVGMPEVQKADNEPQPEVTIVTLGEINSMERVFPPPLIDGLLERGDSLLISGQGGLGKSLLTLSAGLSVAAGKRVFDQFNVDEPHGVLLLQSENSLKATKNRLEALVCVHKNKPDYSHYQAALDRIFTTMIGDDCRLAGDVLNADFAQILKAGLKATEADLLILDPLISYHSQGENDNSGMRQVLDQLTKIVGPDTATIVTHHHGKGEHTGAHQARGATAILDWARGIITLNKQKHESKNLIRCEHTKAGNFQRAPAWILEVQGPSVVAVEPDILCPPSKVVEVLRELGGTAGSKNQFAKAIMDSYGVSRRTALEAINKAQGFGSVSSKSDGSAYVYSEVIR